MTKSKNILLNLFFYLVLLLLAVIFIAPIIIVAYNSFKGKLYIMSDPFAFPTAETFESGNYIRGIVNAGFFGRPVTSVLSNFSESFSLAVSQLDTVGAFGRSLFITVFSVAVMLIFSSMCAWYINRSNSKLCRALYYILVFSMVVPF